MIIGVTGATGNIGKCLCLELLKQKEIDKIRIFAHRKKTTKKLLNKLRKYKTRIELIYGDISNKEDIVKFLVNLDYVINMAGIIPPMSDKYPKAAVKVNDLAVKSLCEEISKININEPKLIHISTVGVYGERNPYHPYAKVGDPLIPTPLDIYALTKVRGEFHVLESDVKKWVILRETAVLHDDLIFNNISDGLMFHTCMNSPLEWVSARDSAILIKNIILKDLANELDEYNFWKKTFNIAGGETNRVTGYDSLDLGFNIIGASINDFFDTNYSATRNFHGVWFSDGYKLEDMFHYQNESITSFWKSVLKKHHYFYLARIIPKRLLKRIIIKPLLKDKNAPRYWINNNDIARICAFFGDLDRYNNIPKSWDNYPLLFNNTFPNIDKSYDELRKEVSYIDCGYDKDIYELDIDDLKNVARLRGGKLLSKEYKKGDIYQRLDWEDQDGNIFTARVYTILGCGHWFNISYKENIWDYNRLAKKDKLLASLWYDTHEKGENKKYYFDDNFIAKTEYDK